MTWQGLLFRAVTRAGATTPNRHRKIMPVLARPCAASGRRSRPSEASRGGAAAPPRPSGPGEASTGLPKVAAGAQPELNSKPVKPLARREDARMGRPRRCLAQDPDRPSSAAPRLKSVAPPPAPPPRGTAPSYSGSSAPASATAACTASRPAPSMICARQLVPSATISASSGAALTAGKSASSPICIDTSWCSA